MANEQVDDVADGGILEGAVAGDIPDLEPGDSNPAAFPAAWVHAEVPLIRRLPQLDGDLPQRHHCTRLRNPLY